jgi:GNAT superfamily N-acetyltransferase
VDPTAVLALFDQEMRREPYADADFRVDRKGSVVRLLGSKEHCVLYSRFAPEEAVAGVAEQTAEFRALGLPVEWKVYSHDQPPEVPRLLAEAGYVAKPPETLMVYDLTEPFPPSPRVDGIEIRRIRSPSEARDLESVGRAAFGRTEASDPDRVLDRLDDPELAVFVAYHGSVPVAGGRVECVPGRSFAGLWGGGTVPEFRGRGVYRTLVGARAAFARERGARYLMVEALDGTSRPILERIGFVPLAGVIGWELRPEPRPPSTTTASDRQGHP